MRDAGVISFVDMCHCCDHYFDVAACFPSEGMSADVHSLRAFAQEIGHIHPRRGGWAALRHSLRSLMRPATQHV